MVLRYVSAIAIPVLLLLAIMYSALPELGYETKASARSGDPAAQVELARMYYEGDQVLPDPDKAVEWLEKAVEQKYPDALNTLGQFYLNGHIVEKDEAKGLAMITAAAEQDHPQAQAYLAFAYGRGVGVKPDTGRFLHWVQRAAKNGDARSRFNLAVLKLTGQFVGRDVPGAKKLLVQAADQGYTEAQATLGEFLARGIEGEPDLVEACKWFAIAGTRGHERSNQLLMVIVRSMTTDQMDEAAARANKWLDDRGEGLE